MTGSSLVRAAQFQMGFGDQLGVCAKAHPAAQLGQPAAATTGTAGTAMGHG